jgi:hypothetical protein
VRKFIILSKKRCKEKEFKALGIDELRVAGCELQDADADDCYLPKMPRLANSANT